VIDDVGEIVGSGIAIRIEHPLADSNQVLCGGPLLQAKSAVLSRFPYLSLEMALNRSGFAGDSLS